MLYQFANSFRLDFTFNQDIENTLSKSCKQLSVNNYRSSENRADVVTRFHDCDLSKKGLLFKGPKLLRLLENCGNKKLSVVESDNIAYLEKSIREFSEEEMTFITIYNSHMF